MTAWVKEWYDSQYWSLEDVSGGATATNLVSGGNDGTLVNFGWRKTVCNPFR
jgi:hypothetical protein